MMWVGVILVILTFYFIIKRFDPKMILFLAGFLMCLLSGQWLAAFDKFYSALFTGSIPQIICAAMGYAYLMSFCKCDQHLANFLVKILKKVRAIIIPGVMIAAGLVVMALQSNAGTAAALGPIVIPVMIKAGIHPVMAASVLAVGSQGNFFAFGSHAAMIAEIAGVDITTVVFHDHWPMGAIAYVIAITCLLVIAKVKKEGSGYVDTDGQFVEGETLKKINGYFCFLPFLPIVLVLLGIILNPRLGWFPKFSVQQAMLISTCWALITCRVNVAQGIKAYTNGLGRGLADVVSLIAAAGVFTEGMNLIGITPALTAAMESNPNIAVIGAAVGPAVIAFLCGSGDAATLAFNGSVTPLVSEFGLNPMCIGSMAYLCGCLGRTMSPIAGVTIICAGFAKINPIEISKRAIPGSILSIITIMILLGYVLYQF